MWRSTPRAGSSSSAAIGVTARPRSGERRGTPEPHMRQKETAKNWASGSFHSAASSSPRRKRRPSAEVKPFVAWAAARALWQREQWQLWTRPNGSSTSQTMPPQRQLPASPCTPSGRARWISGSPLFGGQPSKRMRSSEILSQGGAEAAKIWAFGRLPGSSAKRPAGTNRPPAGERPGREEPQVPQKQRWKPGEDS